MAKVRTTNNAKRITASLSLELRRVFALLHSVRDLVVKGLVNIGHPERRRIAVQIEVLVLHAAGLDRQQDQIAALPIEPLPVADGIALALDDVDDEAPLMAVFARARAQLVRENVPVFQHRVV